jgi:hypothetical protein
MRGLRRPTNPSPPRSPREPPRIAPNSTRSSPRGPDTAESPHSLLSTVLRRTGAPQEREINLHKAELGNGSSNLEKRRSELLRPISPHPHTLHSQATGATSTAIRPAGSTQTLTAHPNPGSPPQTRGTALGTQPATAHPCKSWAKDPWPLSLASTHSRGTNPTSGDLGSARADPKPARCKTWP